MLSIVFLLGISKITDKYHLYDGPVLDGGFQRLNDWVGFFSFLYILPTLVIIAYVSFRIAKKLFAKTWLRVVVYLLWIALLIGISFISLIIFTLIFYGFAP
ncbi:hypothetical protein M3197_08910 [Sporosarcina aquimarina]|nr:hypothetical protein [Sporosarcina aquimarina]